MKFRERIQKNKEAKKLRKSYAAALNNFLAIENYTVKQSDICFKNESIDSKLLYDARVVILAVKNDKKFDEFISEFKEYYLDYHNIPKESQEKSILYRENTSLILDHLEKEIDPSKSNILVSPEYFFTGNRFEMLKPSIKNYVMISPGEK